MCNSSTLLQMLPTPFINLHTSWTKELLQAVHLRWKKSATEPTTFVTTMQAELSQLQHWQVRR